MLSQSYGEIEIKYLPALKAEMTSQTVPGKRFAHREALPVIVVYDRKGKWSSPRGGLRPQPVPDASSAKAFHVWPDFSIRSTIVGGLRVGWFPSPVTPKVDAPIAAM